MPEVSTNRVRQHVTRVRVPLGWIGGTLPVALVLVLDTVCTRAMALAPGWYVLVTLVTMFVVWRVRRK